MTSKYLLSAVFTVLSFSAIAANRDSTGVENLDGKKLILHQVDAKETYYGIARRYKVSPKSVIDYNKNAPLRIGSVIKVPTLLPFVEPVATQAPPKTTADERSQGIIEYKVGNKETLFAIAKRFNTKVDDIIALNNIKNNQVNAGQIIKVHQGGSTPVAPAAPVTKRDSTMVASKQDTTVSDSPRVPSNKYGLYEKKEKGVCVWIEDPSMDPKKKLALHRSAPIGTIIKITNPMTNRNDFAKVVGRFTENETTKDVILVVTKNVSEGLGALDKRFQVQLSYGSPNEQ